MNILKRYFLLFFLTCCLMNFLLPSTSFIVKFRKKSHFDASQVKQIFPFLELIPLHTKSGLWLAQSSNPLLVRAYFYLLKNSPKLEWLEWNQVLKASSSHPTNFRRTFTIKNADGVAFTNSQIAKAPQFSPIFDIGLTQAQQLSNGSPKVVVAITDSGTDLDNRYLKDNLWINIIEQNGQTGIDDDGNGFIDDIYGWDFVNRDNQPTDDHGHGTHIAGIIGARNSGHIAGINQQVKLMTVKWLDSNLRGSTALAVQALHYALDQGAQIINCSWAEDNDSENYQPPIALQEAIERAERENALIVAAAGNDGYDIDRYPYYPASFQYPHVISVAAVDSEGELWKGQGFASNFGVNTVDVAAPGVNIASYVLNEKVKELSGTSMAAPFVSGTAALLLALEPHLSAEQIKQRLIKGAKTQRSLRYKIKTAGVINTYYSLINDRPPLDESDPFYGHHEKHEVRIKNGPVHEVVEYKIHKPGAKKMAVLFKRIDLSFSDTLVAVDDKGQVIQQWKHRHQKIYSPYVESDTLILRLISDDLPHSGQGVFIEQIVTL